MHLQAPAIILAVRPHGENNAVVRAMTAEAGMLAGYVRGGRSRALRPVLQPGNAVIGEWRARTEDQLPALTLELVHSRAALHTEPLAAAALEWVTALAAVALPEGLPYPRLYAALEGTIGAIAAAPAARDWAIALVRYETLLISELGYGRDGVSGGPGRDADWDALLALLERNGRAIETHVLTDRRAEALAARGRLIARLKRAAMR